MPSAFWLNWVNTRFHSSRNRPQSQPGPQVGLPQPPFLAQVDMDFRIRSAGTAADFPEIILQPDDAFIGYADDIVPDMIGFIIFRINGDPQLIRRQFQLFCQKFPGPGNDFLLEVIPEGKVAQHFKIRMMAGRMADVFNIDPYARISRRW